MVYLFAHTTLTSYPLLSLLLLHLNPHKCFSFVSQHTFFSPSDKSLIYFPPYIKSGYLGEKTQLLPYCSNRIHSCSLFVNSLNLTENSSPFFLHFALPLPLISGVRNLISFFNYFYLFHVPLSQSRIYSLLLLVCFPHPLKIIYFRVEISYSSFALVQYFSSSYNFTKLLSAVVAITLLWLFSNFDPDGPIPFCRISDLIEYFSLFLLHCSYHPYMFYLHLKFVLFL